MHLYSLCLAWLNLLTHLCLNKEDKISCPTMQSDSHLQSGYQTDYRIQVLRGGGAFVASHLHIWATEYLKILHQNMRN